jgi:hypothetical protein
LTTHEVTDGPGLGHSARAARELGHRRPKRRVGREVRAAAWGPDVWYQRTPPASTNANAATITTFQVRLTQWKTNTSDGRLHRETPRVQRIPAYAD